MFHSLIKHCRNFAIAVVLLLFGLLITEVVLRFRGPLPTHAISNTVDDQLQMLIVPSATTHHEMRRLSRFQVDENIVLNINGLGLRGDVPKADKSATRKRIVFLGDEAVLGPQLADNETVSARLQQFLTNAGMEVEVVNAGVPGFSPLLSWLQFRHELHQLKPDIVVLHFDMSDVADDATYRRSLKQDGVHQVCVNAVLAETGNSGKQICRLVQESALCKWIQVATGFMNAQNPLAADVRYAWTAANRSDLRLRIRHALEPVQSFAALARQEGFHVVVGTAPVPWQVTSSKQFPRLSQAIATNAQWPLTDDLPMQILGAVCRKSEIQFCNTLSAFRNFSQPSKLFLSDSPQLSNYGAALYARELAARLLSLQTASTASFESRN